MRSGHRSRSLMPILSLDIPVITDASNATDILKQGAVVNEDAEAGIVTSMQG